MRARDRLKGAAARRPLGAAVVLLLAVLTLVMGVASSADVVCSSCHAAQAGALAKTGHQRQDCFECHLANGAWDYPEHKATEVSRMYPTLLSGRGLSGPDRQTSRRVCLRCHEDVLERVVAGARIRIAHASCAPEASCDTCHSSIAHPEAVRWSTGPVMDSCLACHAREGASRECATCHVGTPASESSADAISASAISADRVSSNRTWQVTHGADWTKTHGVGGSESCTTCHPEDYCDRCHAVAVPHPVDFGATHGRYAEKDASACTPCHPSEKDFCDACHGIEMPHPTSFVAEHSSIAEGRSDTRCFRCHADTDCEDCHKRHIHPGGATGVPVPWTSTSEERRP